MGAWGHSFSQAEQLLEHHSTLQQRFFPHGAALTEGFSPLLSDPLIQNWGYDMKRKGWKAIWIVTGCYSLLILP